MDERGQVLVEFAMCFVLFTMFVTGIFMVCFWGIGNAYVREATFETARSYATYGDEDRAKAKAKDIIDKGGWLFIKPRTLHINVAQNNDYAVAEIAAEPRVRNILSFYKLDNLHREAKCMMEYRFRKPDEFVEVRAR